VERDYAEAVRWYLKAAEKDNHHAQYRLGRLYDKGRGVERNMEEAVRWYRKAAAKNHGDALNNLGFMYEKGKGVPQDYVLAHKWFNLATASGEANAVECRDLVAQAMSPSQIAEAKKLARERKPKSEQ
jgi:hypothetical protein